MIARQPNVVARAAPVARLGMEHFDVHDFAMTKFDFADELPSRERSILRRRVHHPGPHALVRRARRRATGRDGLVWAADIMSGNATVLRLSGRA
jgi:hypothetical protein